MIDENDIEEFQFDINDEKDNDINNDIQKSTESAVVPYIHDSKSVSMNVGDNEDSNVALFVETEAEVEMNKQLSSFLKNSMSLGLSSQQSAEVNIAKAVPIIATNMFVAKSILKNTENFTTELVLTCIDITMATEPFKESDGVGYMEYFIKTMGRIHKMIISVVDSYYDRHYKGHYDSIATELSKYIESYKNVNVKDVLDSLGLTEETQNQLQLYTTKVNDPEKSKEKDTLKKSLRNMVDRVLFNLLEIIAIGYVKFCQDTENDPNDNPLNYIIKNSYGLIKSSTMKSKELVAKFCNQIFTTQVIIYKKSFVQVVNYAIESKISKTQPSMESFTKKLQEDNANPDSIVASEELIEELTNGLQFKNKNLKEISKVVATQRFAAGNKKRAKEVQIPNVHDVKFGYPKADQKPEDDTETITKEKKKKSVKVAKKQELEVDTEDTYFQPPIIETKRPSLSLSARDKIIMDDVFGCDDDDHEISPVEGFRKDNNGGLFFYGHKCSSQAQRDRLRKDFDEVIEVMFKIFLFNKGLSESNDNLERYVTLASNFVDKAKTQVEAVQNLDLLFKSSSAGNNINA
jgi:hypothetical protein